eukprot:c35084_g1_i1 orf=2-226(-)
MHHLLLFTEDFYNSGYFCNGIFPGAKSRSSKTTMQKCNPSLRILIDSRTKLKLSMHPQFNHRIPEPPTISRDRGR